MPVCFTFHLHSSLVPADGEAHEWAAVGVVLLEERVGRLALRHELEHLARRLVERDARDARLAPQLLHQHARRRQLPLLRPERVGRTLFGKF